MIVDHVPYKTPYINKFLTIIARLYMQKDNEAHFYYTDYEGLPCLCLTIPDTLYIQHIIRDNYPIYFVKTKNQKIEKEFKDLELLEFAENYLKKLYRE